MEFTKYSASVKTRFLIVSDTHGMAFRSENRPHQHADVAIHCGDLTEESKLEEYRTSIRLLKDIHAPLKLVIAGNHDFTMDTAAFKKKFADARPPLEPKLVRKVYGDFGEARQIFEEAKAAGIVFLDEGSHQFILENRALLTVFASPWTPSLGDWGFQYPQGQGHNFKIMKGVDLVITHGPAKVSWTTTMLDRGLDVRIFSKLSLELDHGCTALGIFTRAGGRNWSLGAINSPRHPHTLRISTTKELSSWRNYQASGSPSSTHRKSKSRSQRKWNFIGRNGVMLLAAALEI